MSLNLEVALHTLLKLEPYKCGVSFSNFYLLILRCGIYVIFLFVFQK